MIRILLLLTMLCALFIFVPGCISSNDSHPSNVKVVYEITGSAQKVDVTLNNATGGTEQYSNVSLPHRYTYYHFTDQFVYISAQNQGEYGSVTVTIYVNGEVLKTSTSTGAYVIATASDSLLWR